MSNIKWKKENECLIGVHKKHKSFKDKKIATFDLDSTLIKTKSGKRHPKDKDDWVLWDDSVKPKLKKISKKYKIIIITNQSGLKGKKDKESDWKQKVEDIIDHLNIPISILACMGKSMYRKPLPGMWNYLDGDIDCSFYCGDAAGRAKKGSIKKDFSDSDLKFALNVGLEFYTPEEYFLGKKDRETNAEKLETLELTKKPFDVTKWCKKNKVSTKKQQMIIMCGYPGSGKSYLSKQLEDEFEFVVINRDTLKTIPKCLKLCKQSLKDDKSVIIDNTNGKKKDRQKFIDLAEEFNVKLNCIILDTSLDQALHNAVYRHMKDPDIKLIPKVVYYTYRKYYEEPDENEGYDNIIHYLPKIYKKDIDQDIFNMYLEA